MILEQKSFNEYNNLIFNSKLDLMKYTRESYGDELKILIFPKYSDSKLSKFFIQNIINFY